MSEGELTNILMKYEGYNRAILSAGNFETLFTSNLQKLLFNLSTKTEFIPLEKYFRKQIPDLQCRKFTDPLFPPQESSLLYLNPNNEATKEITAEEIATLKAFSWRRVGEIMGESYVLYNKIEIEDINQGAIGNCYFLSALSAIAEFDDRFDNIFVTKKRQENGCYQVKLVLQGIPEIVTLDDYFPVEKGRFACATSGRNEIWVQLLEKAYAKVNESYASTIAGLPGEALATLTEAPVMTYIHRKFSEEKLNQLWEVIKISDQKNYILCTNTGNSENTSKMGLVPCHAYTLISAFEIDGLKLLKIRNPWGQFEWKGDFSDKSEKWQEYPGLKEKVNFLNKNDGIFFMTFADYLTYFPYTYICKYENGFKYHYKKVEQSSNESMVGCKFTLDQETEICLTLHQKQQRFYSSVVAEYKLGFAKIILARYNKGKYEYIGSDSNDVEKLHVECGVLPPGEYHVFCHVNWCYETACRYVISTYADKEVSIDYLDEKKVPANYLMQILNSYMLKNSQSKRVDEFASYSASLGDNKIGFNLLQLENLSERNLKVECHAESSIPVPFLSKSQVLNEKVTKETDKIKDEFSVIVPPKSQTLLVWNLVSQPYKTRLGFSNMSFQTIIEEVHHPTVHNQTQDHRLALIEGYFNVLDKKKIHDNLFYTELDLDDEVLLVFRNSTQLNNYNLKIEFIDSSNVKLTSNKQLVFNVFAESFYYIALNKEDNNEKVNFSFNLSVKKVQVKA